MYDCSCEFYFVNEKVLRRRVYSIMLLISNPVAGAGTGRDFIDNHVIPLLGDYDLEINTTVSAGDASNIAVSYAKAHSEPVIIASGGDGTLHEIVNGLVQLDDIRNGSKPIEIILIPVGTANALYSSLFPPRSYGDLDITKPAYKLLSLQSYLSRNSDASRSRSVPLAIQTTSFLNAGGEEVSNILSVVVTSTSLHASILDTAYRLKAQRDIVGVERFKVAAMENISNWYYSSVELRPLPSGEGHNCLKYDSATRRFEPWAETSLEGPFEYFLSTVNVDRLEPDFCIAPLQSRIPGDSGNNQSHMDLVIIRPYRSPKLKGRQDNEENRKAFEEISIAALGHAYKDGAHVDLQYTADGSYTLSDGVEQIVEYFRCGGWEWTPERGDDLAKLVCADGTIIAIPAGGKAVCTLLTGGEAGMKLNIWAQ